MENRSGFMINTATDYDMNYSEVAQIYNHHKDNLYEKLEEALIERRNR